VTGLGLCPSLFAVSYTWNFLGSGSNPGSTGNSLTFNASPAGGPTVKATAWYLNGTTSSATFASAALGQYTAGLGVCYPTENCAQPEHQTDNNVYDEYVLLEFSSPVDPSSISITTTSGGDLDASYWLGGASPTQNLSLTGKTVADLTSLGFGAKNDNTSSATGSRTVDLTAGIPAGAVNKILFGTKYGDNDDYFKIGSMAGTYSAPVSGVPEPSSITLLATIALAGVGLAARRRKSAAKSSVG
jgi:hypothetical protein